MSAKRFITPVDAGRIADIETQYIRRLAAKGTAFISTRSEGRILIDYDSFQEWLQGYRVRRHRPVFTGEPTAVGA